jgi:hypothetical protein
MGEVRACDGDSSCELRDHENRGVQYLDDIGIGGLVVIKPVCALTWIEQKICKGERRVESPHPLVRGQDGECNKVGAMTRHCNPTLAR